MCGGTSRSKSPARISTGLSPRVRGNPADLYAKWIRERSIPACAGEPQPARTIASGQKVYPRVCGGTQAGFSDRYVIKGLSPRVRGNPRGAGKCKARERSIPACAGEPRACEPPPVSKRVYPRVCGGTSMDNPYLSQEAGLSPRVRGNPACLLRQGPPLRSIPACAGEPSPRQHCRSHKRVYPRVCGGTKPCQRVEKYEQGLSPRVRGNPAPADCRRVLARSIPACAGEPRARPQSQPPNRVYPRVCGGTIAPSDTIRITYGLSPRVRGNPGPALALCHCLRSIPACAGEPIGSTPTTIRTKVYPRVCGGTDVLVIDGAGAHGLSPRVRGNQ